MPDEPGAPCAAREAGAFVHRAPLRLGLPCVRLRHCPQGWRELPGRGAEGRGQQRRLRRCRAAAGDLGGGDVGRAAASPAAGMRKPQRPPARASSLIPARPAPGRAARLPPLSFHAPPRPEAWCSGGGGRCGPRGGVAYSLKPAEGACFASGGTELMSHRRSLTRHPAPKHPQNMTSSRALPPAPKGPNHPLWLRVVCV